MGTTTSVESKQKDLDQFSQKLLKLSINIDNGQFQEEPDLAVQLLVDINKRIPKFKHDFSILFNGIKQNWKSLLFCLKNPNTLISTEAAKILNLLSILLENQKALSDETLDFLMDSQLNFDQDTLITDLFTLIVQNSVSNFIVMQYQMVEVVFNLIREKYFISILVEFGLINSYVINLQDKEFKQTFQYTSDGVKIIQIKSLKEIVTYNDKQIINQIYKAKGIVPLVNICLKSKVQIIKEQSAFILAELAKSYLCKQDIIINKGLEICIKEFLKTDSEEIQFECMNLANNICDTESLCIKARKLGLIKKAIDVFKTTQKSMVKYQAMTLLFQLSTESSCFNMMKILGFFKLLDNIQFKEIKNLVELKTIIYHISQFCSKALELNSSFIFLNLIDPFFNLLQYIQNEILNTQQKEIIIQLQEIQYMLLESLQNLSLRRDCQKQIAKPQYMTIIITEIQDFQVYDQNLLNHYVRIITNLFMNTENFLLSLNYDLQEFIKDIYHWIVSEENKTWQQLEIKDEIELYICLLPNFHDEQNELKKLAMAKKHVKSDNIHLSTKCSAILNHLALDLKNRSLMVQNKALDTLNFCLLSKYNSVVREASSALANMIQNPDGMAVWLKFDSAKLNIDSANQYCHIVYGDPKSMPNGRGLYNNWGAFFDYGDLIETLGDGIILDNHYTVSFWCIYPMPNSKNFQHTLLQQPDGQGGHLLVDETLTYFGIYDDKTKKLVYLDVDLKQALNQGTWNHICVNYNMIRKRVTFFFNGDKVGKSIEVSQRNPIKYICNDKSGLEPFGVVVDLRIYLRSLNMAEIENLATYDEKAYNNKFPDKLSELMIQVKLVPNLLNALERNYEEIQEQILKLFANIATKRNCKLLLLKQGILPYLIKNINQVNDKVRIQAQRSLFNLN